MGIGRKSRKLKGKKRQTGRKIRRGTRRNRLGRVSRMKGGMQPSERVANTTNTFQSECESIKKKLETLRGAVRNTLQEEVTERESQIAVLTQQLDQAIRHNEDLTARVESLTASEQSAAEQAQAAQAALQGLQAEQAVQAGQAEQAEQARAAQEARAAALQEALAREQQEAQGARAREQAQGQALQEAQEALAREQAQGQAQGQARQSEFDNMIDQIIANVNALKQTCVTDINGELDALEIELRNSGCLRSPPRTDGRGV